MKVSIVIPVKQVNKYIEDAIPFYMDLDYHDFEILILPDSSSNHSFQKSRIIATGNVGPAIKRDMALDHAKGELLAFIDDDAFPRHDWLNNAVRHFSDNKVAAVGGPAVTPENSSFWQKVSGSVFLSKMSGGYPERYWPSGGIHNVDDWPSVNIIIRKDVFKTVGGFDSEFWPGEDTKLCLDIVKLGKEIVYDPEVYVWHHRRASLIHHLKQIGSYGLHRGHFAKIFPETSFRIKYFIPSLFLLSVITITPISVFNESIFKLFLAGVFLYSFALCYAMFEIYIKDKNFIVSFFCLPYIFLTHLWYGARFIQGFVFTRNLKSKLRAKPN